MDAARTSTSAAAHPYMPIVLRLMVKAVLRTRARCSRFVADVRRRVLARCARRRAEVGLEARIRSASPAEATRRRSPDIRRGDPQGRLEQGAARAGSSRSRVAKPTRCFRGHERADRLRTDHRGLTRRRGPDGARGVRVLPRDRVPSRAVGCRRPAVGRHTPHKIKTELGDPARGRVKIAADGELLVRSRVM